MPGSIANAHSSWLRSAIKRSKIYRICAGECLMRSETPSSKAYSLAMLRTHAKFHESIWKSKRATLFANTMQGLQHEPNCVFILFKCYLHIRRTLWILDAILCTDILCKDGGSLYSATFELDIAFSTHTAKTHTFQCNCTKVSLVAIEQNCTIHSNQIHISANVLIDLCNIASL